MHPTQPRTDAPYYYSPAVGYLYVYAQDLRTKNYTFVQKFTGTDAVPTSCVGSKGYIGMTSQGKTIVAGSYRINSVAGAVWSFSKTKA